MSLIVYVDESGDCGWSLEQPYQKGGSSRYLTVAYLIVPSELKQIPKRLVKDAYRKFHFDTHKEAKGNQLEDEQRDYIVDAIIRMLEEQPVLRLGAITVMKERVQEHIRADSNKLYNYMLGLMILDKIEHSPDVILVRDERSVKVKSGNSCKDYLESMLWFHRKSVTVIQDKPSASKNNLSLIFIDWVANTIWSHFEIGAAKYFGEFNKLPNVLLRRLFF